MKKLFVLCLTVLFLFSLGAIAGAKTLKVGLDAGPVSQDPQVQLSGGMLQYSHWVFDPLVRYAQDMHFEPRL
ncbi:MAG: ABC transporter substrate-binding protein, partial [Pseudomonadota bacterium]